MIARKEIGIGFLWLVVVLALLFVYPSFAEQIEQKVPLAFLLLAPFGIDWFPQWIGIVGMSYWATRATRWVEPAIRKTIKWNAVVINCVLILHAAWVVFVLAKGGL
jgi:uncharacterized membrane protein